MKNKYSDFFNNRKFSNLAKGISANILLLGIVSFLNDLSSEMIMPILPMFITALGGSGLVIGLIGGLRDSISSILKVFAGFWSDRSRRRKIFITYGYLTSSFFKLLLAFSKIWQHIMIFASFERIGKGLRTAPRDAIIADSMPEEKGKGFGVHRALDTSGAILGSIVVFFLFWFFGFSFKLIIFIAAILAFLSLIPLYFVKEKTGKPQNINLEIGIRSFPKPLKLFILISGIFALANFSYMFFILKAQEAFTPSGSKHLIGQAGKLSIGLPILLYLLFNIFYTLFAIPFGVLSDKIGREKMLIFGYLLFSLTSLGFAFFNSLIAFIVLFIFYGIVYAIIDGNQRAFVADLSSDKLKATALGTFHTVISLVALPASLIAGFLWQNIASNTTFIYGSIVSIISVILFIIFRNYFRE